MTDHWWSIRPAGFKILGLRSSMRRKYRRCHRPRYFSTTNFRFERILPTPYLTYSTYTNLLLFRDETLRRAITTLIFLCATSVQFKLDTDLLLGISAYKLSIAPDISRMRSDRTRQAETNKYRGTDTCIANPNRVCEFINYLLESARSRSKLKKV